METVTLLEAALGFLGGVIIGAFIVHLTLTIWDKYNFRKRERR